jgi:ABC-type uncharacterized transport system ATPase subunit
MKVELLNIHKYFGPVRANDDVSLTVAAGAIHGLLGENGAGKSTLMKVLSGYIAPDSGTIRLDGRPLTFASPSEAIHHGVGMLHQDALDFPPLKVLDNFILARDNRLRQRRTAARRELMTLSERFNFPLDPDAYVSSLTVGERQQLEILRLLALGVQVLILDEPTTGLSAPQKARLFETLHRLAAEGKTIVFVSHKLEEVEELCSRVTVLRRGQMVGEEEMPCPTERLIELMFGQVLASMTRRDVALGEPVLQVEEIEVETYRFDLAPVSLEVRAGEVIGLAGLEGSGQRLFIRACAGLIKPTAGRVLIGGRDMTRRPYQEFLKAGVAYVPASRLEEGLVPGLTLREHAVLTDRRSQPFFINWAKATDAAKAMISRFNIHGRPGSPVESLSGGNQQRALLALMPDTLSLLLLEHPTRGLDIESTMWVWSQLLARREQGTAIFFTSADLDEIMQWSDRIMVFFGGQVIEILSTADTSAEQLGQLIGGKRT